MLRIFSPFRASVGFSSIYWKVACSSSLGTFTYSISRFSVIQAHNILQSPSLHRRCLTGAVMVLSGLYHTKCFPDYPRAGNTRLPSPFVFLCPIAIGLGFFTSQRRH